MDTGGPGLDPNPTPRTVLRPRLAVRSPSHSLPEPGGLEQICIVSRQGGIPLDAEKDHSTACPRGGFPVTGSSEQAIYQFSAPLLDGRPASLAEFRGRVLLIVNTASQCGFTPQYAGLEELYGTYKDRGFAVLGFPCNQFGAQEPGQAAEIGAFCEKNYGVTFPIFDKIDVNGPEAHPLYKFLKQSKPGILGTEGIKWNFTKFLVDREGQVVRRYAATAEPKTLGADIERLLGSQ